MGTVQGGPAPVSISKQEREVAQTYLNARENAESYYQKTNTSWVDEAKPAMSDSFYKKMKAEGASNGQYQWDMAHKLKIKVKVTSQCDRNENAPSTPTRYVAICSVTDLVVDEKGKPYPLSKVPEQWGNGGQMPTAQLVMAKQGDSWVVADDATGMAG